MPDLGLEERYEIWIEVYPQPNEIDAWLSAKLTGIDSPSVSFEIGPLAVSNFFVEGETGLFGLGANRSIAEFLSYKIETLIPP